MGSLAYLGALTRPLAREIQALEALFMKLGILEKGETDGQSERTIQVLEDIMRACVIDFGGHWDRFLPLYEFSYNNSYHSSIKMAPFEELYGRGCRSPKGWFEAEEVEPLGVDLVRDTRDKELQYEEERVTILDRNVRELRTKDINMAKVQWKHRSVEEATWEIEKDMRQVSSTVRRNRSYSTSSRETSSRGVIVFSNSRYVHPIISASPSSAPTPDAAQDVPKWHPSKDAARALQESVGDYILSPITLGGRFQTVSVS
ncbi:uncharacterized protein LOC129875763 [Solanum dulcamara]|uniref:uncharacterized protein LOC129875763 n=1 Tax=Solanum dulcamara TaxID=45834 RepID=UPI00248534BF|nr:uncharacterized protein LOC129875763 [Solanum dulcamara]